MEVCIGHRNLHEGQVAGRSQGMSRLRARSVQLPKRVESRPRRPSSSVWIENCDRHSGQRLAPDAENGDRGGSNLTPGADG